MTYGLNRAYEVEERRSWWRFGLTIGGLTLALGLTTCVALFLMFGGVEIETHFHIRGAVLRGVEWLSLILCLSFCFGCLYRFAPNPRNLGMALEHTGRSLRGFLVGRRPHRGSRLLRPRE